MLYLGMVVGIGAGNVAAHAAGINAFRTYVATLVLIPTALVGARLLYVITHWHRYRHDRRRIWDRSDGGAAMYGGLYLALVLSVPLLASLRLPWGAFWDVAIITILVGMIFTRIGCLLNGCCGGRPSKTWGSLYLPNRLGVWEKRVPTQCLEGLWAAVLLVSGLSVWGRLPFAGALFLLVVAGYAAGRMVLESLREPKAGAGANRFTLHHALSAMMMLLSLAVLTARWPK